MKTDQIEKKKMIKIKEPNKWLDNKFGKPDKTGKRKSFGFNQAQGGKG